MELKIYFTNIEILFIILVYLSSIFSILPPLPRKPIQIIPLLLRQAPYPFSLDLFQQAVHLPLTIGAVLVVEVVYIIVVVAPFKGKIIDYQRIGKDQDVKYKSEHGNPHQRDGQPIFGQCGRLHHHSQ